MDRRKINLCEGMDIYYVSYTTYESKMVYDYLLDELCNYFGTKKADRISVAICDQLFPSHKDSCAETEEVLITDSGTMTVYRLNLDGEKPEFKVWNPFENVLENGFLHEIRFDLVDKALNATYTNREDSFEFKVSDEEEIRLYKKEILISSKHTYLESMLIEEFKLDTVNNILRQVDDEILFKRSWDFNTITITDGKPTIVPAKNVFSQTEDVLTKMGYSKNEIDNIIGGTPKWTPRGYSHIEGTLETGYVIADGKGNEYVYIPDLDQFVSRYIISKGDGDYPMSVANGKPWCDITDDEASAIVRKNVVDFIACNESEYFERDSLGVGATIVNNYRWIVNFLNKKLKINPSVKQNDYIYNICLANPVICFSTELTNFADTEDILYARCDHVYHSRRSAKALDLKYTGQKMYLENDEVKLQSNRKEDIISDDTTGMGFRIVLIRPSIYRTTLSLPFRHLSHPVFIDSEETQKSEKYVDEMMSAITPMEYTNLYLDLFFDFTDDDDDQTTE